MTAQVDVSRCASAGAQGTESEFSHTPSEGSTNAAGLAQEYPHGSLTHSSPWPTQKLKTVEFGSEGGIVFVFSGSENHPPTTTTRPHAGEGFAFHLSPVTGTEGTIWSATLTPPGVRADQGLCSGTAASLARRLFLHKGRHN